jgi:AcrR family transcriptional regulator
MPVPADGPVDVDFESEPRLTRAGHRLLDAASGLFYERGIRAVGVDLVAQEAGTTKKTLYDCFGSKDALVALYLRHRAIRWQQFLLTRLGERGLEADHERVLAVFDALQAWHDDGERGCAFVNAYAEVGGSDHPGVAVIRAEKQWMHSLFSRLARGTGVAHPEEVGDLLHMVYEGALVQATAGGMPDAIGRARTAAAEILGR